MLLLILILLILWALGNWAPFSPVRGNNVIHVLLVVIVVIILYQLLVGGSVHFPRLR